MILAYLCLCKSKGYMILNRETFFELVRFGVVGVIATALH